MRWFKRRPNVTLINCQISVDVHPRPGGEPHPAVTSTTEVVIPTDLVFAAFRQLFPAERMVVLGGSRTRQGVRITSLVDVTEAHPSVAHVRACPQKLAQALLDFERTGTHLALWLHSHPGDGIRATHPSDIDLNQERQLREHYSGDLLCAIAVRDGYLRLWGEALRDERIQLNWRGQGIHSLPEARHVYKLALS